MTLLASPTGATINAEGTLEALLLANGWEAADDDAPAGVALVTQTVLDAAIDRVTLDGLEVIAYGGCPSYRGVYDATTDTTWTAIWSYGDIWVVGVNHTTGAIDGPIKAGTFAAGTAGGRSDGHGIPTIALDGAGYIHVVWCAHDSIFQWAKSRQPRNAAAGFTETTQPSLAVGTYPSMCYDPDSAAIWCVYRAGATTHQQSWPSHNQLALVKLPDGAGTWTNVKASGIVDLSDYGVTFPGRTTDVYTPWITPTGLGDGRLYLTGTMALGTVHDDKRTNVWLAVYDTNDGTLRNIAGTDLGDRMSFAEATTWPTWVRQPTGYIGGPDGVSGGPHEVNGVQCYALADGSPLVLWWENNDNVAANAAIGRLRCARWVAGAWTFQTISGVVDYKDYPGVAVLVDGTDVDVYAVEWMVLAGSWVRRLVRYSSTDSAATFAAGVELYPLTANDFFFLGAVLDAHPTMPAIVGTAQPEPTAPIQGLFDGHSTLQASATLVPVPAGEYIIGDVGAPAFQNGWGHKPGLDKVRIVRHGGRVRVEGSASGGASGTVMFTFGAGWRPAATTRRQCGTHGGTGLAVVDAATGTLTVTADSGNINTSAYLDFEFSLAAL